MKRIISAVVLLFVCIGICVFGSFAAENKGADIMDTLDKLESEIKDGKGDEAYYLIKELEKEWEKSEKLFSSISETSLIDEIDISLSSIEKYIITDMTEEAIIVIEECRCGIETIVRRQKISLDNIL